MKFSSMEPNVSLSCHLKLITVYYLIIQLQNLKRRLLIENIFEKYDEIFKYYEECVNVVLLQDSLLMRSSKSTLFFSQYNFTQG